MLADASAPFELNYIDIASPPGIAAALRGEAEARGLRLLRHDDRIAPALARKQVLADIETTYVAFTDNDILVEPGCLRTLLGCAEETGAGLVCPLYLQIGGRTAPTIHMSGGVFTWADGRPFLNHVIGRASVLIRYELDAHIVRAGLIHSLLKHRPDWMAIEAIDKALAAMPRTDLLIRGQRPARRLLAAHDTDVLSLNIVGAGVAALLAANEADMRLSGEYAATGRPAEIDARGLDRIGSALSLFGVDGLVRTARTPTDQVDGAPWPLLGIGVRTQSFPLAAQRRRLSPINDVFERGA